MARRRGGGGRRASSLAGILAVLVLIALSMSSCAEEGTDAPASSSSPSTPDITGIVWQVSDNGDGTGSLLVVGLEGAPGDYDRASVRITSDTIWFVRDDETTGGPLYRDMNVRPTPAPALQRELIGRQVAVAFTGPVAESYPVQATASSVALLEPLGVSMHVTPAMTRDPQLRGMCLAIERDDTGRITSLTVLPDESLTTSGGDGGDVVQATVRITHGTSWLLDTPTELKMSEPLLIGNGVEPRVDVVVRGRTAEWVVVHLRDLQVAE